MLPAPPNNHYKGARAYQATKTRIGFHFSVCAPAFRTCSTRILQFSNPPGRVKGAPEFAKTKKRESYFQEFCSVTETFQENRVKAHRLSDEAAAFALQVSSISVRVTAVPPFSHAFSFRTKHLVEQVTSSISSLYLSYRDRPCCSVWLVTPTSIVQVRAVYKVVACLHSLPILKESKPA